jgi:hypothetical protein
MGASSTGCLMRRTSVSRVEMVMETLTLRVVSGTSRLERSDIIRLKNALEARRHAFQTQTSEKPSRWLSVVQAAQGQWVLPAPQEHAARKSPALSRRRV